MTVSEKRSGGAWEGHNSSILGGWMMTPSVNGCKCYGQRCPYMSARVADIVSIIVIGYEHLGCLMYLAIWLARIQWFDIACSRK